MFFVQVVELSVVLVVVFERTFSLVVEIAVHSIQFVKHVEDPQVLSQVMVQHENVNAALQQVTQHYGY